MHDSMRENLAFGCDCRSGCSGSIQLVLGPMFSGKSSEMSRRIRRHIIARRPSLVIKYRKDLRYEGSESAVVTHDAVRLTAQPATRLADVDDIVDAYQVIGVDEGQFFDDVVEYAEKWANMGKTVIIAALDGDFKRKPFGRVLELVPMAEDVVKLNAVCTSCGLNAAFTKRTTSDDAIEVVGGADMYRAACRACHERESSHAQTKGNDMASTDADVNAPSTPGS